MESVDVTSCIVMGCNATSLGCVKALIVEILFSANHNAFYFYSLLVFQIDILVNNGGRSQRALIEETDLDVDKALIDLNVLGTLSLTKAVLPHFAARKAGHVVVTSSVAGKIGT